jgi:integrase
MVKGLDAYSGNMAFSELCDWYFDAASTRQNSQESAHHAIARYMLPKFGGTKIADIRPAALTAHFAWLVKEGAQPRYTLKGGIDISQYKPATQTQRDQAAAVKAGKPVTALLAGRIVDALGGKIATYFVEEKRGISVATVKTIRTCVSAIFSAAVKAGMIQDNPVSRASTPKDHAVKKERATIPREQVESFFKCIDGIEYAPLRMLFLTMISTGARGCEVRALDWSDIDIDAHAIRINKSVDNKGRVTDTKTGSSRRTLQIGEKLAAALRGYRDGTPGEGIAFPAPEGGHYTQPVLSYWLHKAIRGSGLPQDLSPHGLRHSVASICIAGGMDAHAVQRQLGHSSISITLDTYYHEFTDEARKRAAFVEHAVWGGVGEKSENLVKNVRENQRKVIKLTRRNLA